MLKLSLVTLTICFMTFAQTVEAGSNDSWRPLFNGNSLVGWHNPFDWGEASVVDEEIVLTSDKKFFLVSNKSYKDFELEAEVFVPVGGNSGIQFRSHYRWSWWSRISRIAVSCCRRDRKN